MSPPLTWIPVDEDVAHLAGSLARRHRRSCGGIGDADYMIAAAAIFLGAEPLTANVRHFPMLPVLTAPY